jgi:hypothetical protein
MGMLDHDSRKVRAQVAPNIKREALQNAIPRQNPEGFDCVHYRAVGYDNLAAQEYVLVHQFSERRIFSRVLHQFPVVSWCDDRNNGLALRDVLKYVSNV